MNNLDLCLGRIKVTSTIALHSTLNISETVKLEIEAWFQRVSANREDTATHDDETKLAIVASLQPDQDYGTVCQGLCVNPRHSKPSKDN